MPGPWSQPEFRDLGVNWKFEVPESAGSTGSRSRPEHRVPGVNLFPGSCSHSWFPESPGTTGSQIHPRFPESPGTPRSCRSWWRRVSWATPWIQRCGRLREPTVPGDTGTRCSGRLWKPCFPGNSGNPELRVTTRNRRSGWLPGVTGTPGYRCNPKKREPEFRGDVTRNSVFQESSVTQGFPESREPGTTGSRRRSELQVPGYIRNISLRSHPGFPESSGTTGSLSHPESTGTSGSRSWAEPRVSEVARNIWNPEYGVTSGTRSSRWLRVPRASWKSGFPASPETPDSRSHAKKRTRSSRWLHEVTRNYGVTEYSEFRFPGVSSSSGVSGVIGTRNNGFPDSPGTPSSRRHLGIQFPGVTQNNGFPESSRVPWVTRNSV